MSGNSRSRLFHAPILFFLLLTCAPLYLYVVIRDVLSRKSIFVSLGLIFLVTQSILFIAVYYLLAIEVVLPPWTDKIVLLWCANIGVVFVLLVIICQLIQRDLFKWVSCLMVMAVSFSIFLYLSKPLDYFYALLFHEKMSGQACSVFCESYPPSPEEMENYKSFGNYQITDRIQLANSEEAHSATNAVTVKDYQVSLPTSYIVNNSSAFLATYSNDDYHLFFMEPYEYLNEYKIVINETINTSKAVTIQKAYNFQDNYEFYREMFMTTYEDIEKASSFQELVRADTLYVSKVTATGISPPVYEFYNDDIKGFLGSDKAIVFDKDNTLIYEITLTDNNSTDTQTDKSQTLRNILASIQTNER